MSPVSYFMRSATSSALSFLIALSGTAVTEAALQGAASKPWPLLPGDTNRIQELLIAESPAEYGLTIGGRIDGAMTRTPPGSYAPQPGWQPDRSLRIENTGTTDIVNPWITVNGRGDWRTLASMLAESLQGCTNEADSARAIWEWTRTRRFHGYTFDKEVYDAVKAFTVYGYTLCSQQAHILTDFWRTAGFPTRPGRPTAHSTSEVYYDGAFHMFDGDMTVFCLGRDNRTVASEPDIVRDHDLMKRTHTYGITEIESRLQDEFVASLYSYQGDRTGEYDIFTKHALHFVLRPGEALEWRWWHIGKQYSAGIGLRQWGSAAYSNLRNGKWQYAVPLASPVYRNGVFSESNLIHSSEDGLRPHLRPRVPGLPASVIWKISGPFVFVGAAFNARLRLATETDSCLFHFSTDNRNWGRVAALGYAGDSLITTVFDSLVSPPGKPAYSFYLRCEFQNPSGGTSGLDSLVIDADIQLPALSPWDLRLGANRLHYTDQTVGPRSVRIVHGWTERSEWRPPLPPQRPVFPADRAVVRGSLLTFRWEGAAPSTAGAAIADCHFQLSDRGDFRWPLSPNFDRLVSFTPDSGTASWTVPSRGLLNPDTDYWWRVRAKDSKGVWSPWSPAWLFRILGPSVPDSLWFQPESASLTASLRWRDPPVGSAPAAWRIYGSDEQGFTASDSPYSVLTVLNRTVTPAVIESALTPSNLLAETREKRFFPSSRIYAFYRIAAVDSSGTLGGVSDFIALDRPVITSRPDTIARTDESFRYLPLTIHSIGQLTYRTTGGAAFWDRETLSYALIRGPAWLTFTDSLLAGVPGPADTGLFHVTLRVSNNKGGSSEQSFTVRVDQGSPSAVAQAGVTGSPIPAVHSLAAAGPNPFASGTAIRFGVPRDSRGVRVAVYDATGRLVRLLAEGAVPPGYHTARFGGPPDGPEKVPQGLYFCRMRAQGFNRVVRLIRIE